MTEEHPQIFESKSENDTSLFAQRVARQVNGGDYISLEGDLGAGKTFFSREFARALGITENVTSPTFLLQKTYTVNPPHNNIVQLTHYDFYRIASYYELIDLGFEDHDNQTVVLAEWGDLYLEDFPKLPIRLCFRLQPDNTRLIEVHNLILQ